MRAIVQEHYGTADEFRLVEITEPELAPDGVLVDMEAASVDAGVYHLMTADIVVVRLAFGLRRPRKRPGIAFAGRIRGVGADVRVLTVGQRVYGTSSGAFAEVIAAKSDRIAALPDGVDPVLACTVPVSAVTALQAVRDHGRVQSGQRVLVTGASGGVGLFAVQLAAAAGGQVTAVCSGGKADLVRACGATEVVDYATEPIRGTYDVIIDIASPLPFGATRRLLAPGGTLVIVGASAHHGATGGLGRNLLANVITPFVPESLRWFVQSENSADLTTLATSLADGSLRPVVDSVHPLAQSADAMRRYASGQARGKVVITS
jgi:NADPH:quinone reductase-like Zn-dependent oxidoreductase